MKRDVFFLLIMIAGASVVVLPSCTRKKDRVKEYIETINAEHQRVADGLDALERSLEQYIPEDMDRSYQAAMDQLDSSALVIAQLEVLKGEEDLRDDAVMLFDTYRMLLSNEYSEIIRLQKKPAGTFTYQDQFYVENLGKFITNHRRKAKEKFETEAALVLERYKVPFSPVIAELDTVSSARTTD
ncbi:MAG: hypothetical protein R6V49_03040 [Bacteroidales bacterium]